MNFNNKTDEEVYEATKGILKDFKGKPGWTFIADQAGVPYYAILQLHGYRGTMPYREDAIKLYRVCESLR